MTCKYHQMKKLQFLPGGLGAYIINLSPLNFSPKAMACAGHRAGISFSLFSCKGAA